MGEDNYDRLPPDKPDHDNRMVDLDHPIVEGFKISRIAAQLFRVIIQLFSHPENPHFKDLHQHLDQKASEADQDQANMLLDAERQNRRSGGGREKIQEIRWRKPEDK